jgi:hypothetical protein
MSMPPTGEQTGYFKQDGGIDLSSKEEILQGQGVDRILG